MTENDSRYIYDRHGMKASRVGQAVYDILSKPQPAYTAGDILEGMAEKYIQDFEKSIEYGVNEYKSPFYILVLTKKDPWAVNVIRNKFVPRQTPPHCSDMLIEYPNHTKTLYIVDADKGHVEVAWSIPSWQDCQEVAKHPETYSPELVQWVVDCFEGRLDKDDYSYLLK